MFKQFKLDSRLIKEIDKTVLISLILLILYGTLNIYLSTKGMDNGMSFVKKQVLAFGLSLVALYFLMAIDYKIIYDYVPIFYWGTVVLLILAKIPGIGMVVNGARGWIGVGSFQIQPAEYAKIGIILMLGKQLEEMDGKINDVKNFFILALFCCTSYIYCNST